MDRRAIFKTSGPGALALGSCFPPEEKKPSAGRISPPVKVDPGRVIRTACRILLFVLFTTGLFVPGRAIAMEDGSLHELLILPQEGERFTHVEFSCWIPDVATPLRGVIIHQHGCTNASPEAHPPVTLDFHWRALARKHQLAILSPQYQVAGSCDEWNDPESGSERALFSALVQIGKESGHPELGELPWVLWGHSGGSSWSSQMILRHPHRVLAASFRGGCSKQFGVPEFRAEFGPAARKLPLLFVWGRRESVPESKHFVSWEPMNTMYRELRELGGTVTRVIDPLSEHGCDNSRLFVIPFFDAVLTALENGETLPGVLRDMTSLGVRELNERNLHDPVLTWLPNPGVGEWWREFSETGTLRSAGGDLVAPLLSVSREENGSARLGWTVNPQLGGGLRTFRLFREGKLWKELGVKPGAPVATSRDAPPEGLREHGLVDGEGVEGTYTLSFLDAAGNESPKSEAVKLR